MKNKKITREQLYTVVKLLVQEKSDSFTMDDLAEKMGISRATLYREFGGKNKILKSFSGKNEDMKLLLNNRNLHLRIIEGARKVFCRSGFHKATIEEVAHETGVGSATIYRYFKSKDGLVEAFNDHYSPRKLLMKYISEMDKIEGGRELPLEEILIPLTVEIMKFLYNNKDLIRLTFTTTYSREYLNARQDRPGRTVPNLIKLFSEYINKGELRKGNPEEMTFAYLGLIFSFSFFIPIYFGTSLENVHEKAVYVTNTFLDGLRIHKEKNNE